MIRAVISGVHPGRRIAVPPSVPVRVPGTGRGILVDGRSGVGLRRGVVAILPALDARHRAGVPPAVVIVVVHARGGIIEVGGPGVRVGVGVVTVVARAGIDIPRGRLARLVYDRLAGITKAIAVGIQIEHRIRPGAVARSRAVVVFAILASVVIFGNRSIAAAAGLVPGTVGVTAAPPLAVSIIEAWVPTAHERNGGYGQPHTGDQCSDPRDIHLP